jgi:hypothetical protein
VPAVAVVLIDPGRDAVSGLDLGGEVLQVEQFEGDGGVPGLDRGVIQGRPGPAHRLGDAQPGAGGAEGAGDVLAAAIGVRTTPSTSPPRIAAAIANAE